MPELYRRPRPLAPQELAETVQPTACVAEDDRDASPSDAHAGSERRAYFRVATRLPLRLTPLGEEEVRILEREINTPKPELGVLADPALSAALRRIEEKLNLLLDGAGHEPTRPIGEADRSNLVLSGSGLRSETRESFQTGDPVRVELLLPETPVRQVTALASVVYSAQLMEPEGSRRLALRFTAIDEGDRDAVVRHICEVQRLALRKRVRTGHPENDDSA